MALVHADRVKETAAEITGTGTYDLDGAVAGFQTFVAGIGTTNTCHYCATDGVDWEVGIGTVTDATPDTLARTSVLRSSNGDAAVSWSAATPEIFCTIPADKFATLGAAQYGSWMPYGNAGTSLKDLPYANTYQAAPNDGVISAIEWGASTSSDNDSSQNKWRTRVEYRSVG